MLVNSNLIKYGLENKEIYAAAFLDVPQAFDNVWHQGLIFKI